MKIVILAIGLCLLLSCMKEVPSLPQTQTGEAKACVRECQYNNSLCFAGCGISKTCKNKCLDILADCYTTCE